MGRKQKLKRFAEMKVFGNVFEPSMEEVRSGKFGLRGKWGGDYFKNEKPIVLELGCGKGEYTVALSEKHPDKNFIGVDIKGARMWVGAKHCLESGRKNVAFLRTRIEFIDTFFDKNEVDEIWITFPDPQLKERREKNRLTSPSFLTRYKNFIKPGGVVHLKTDSMELHEYTLEVIEEKRYHLLDATRNLYEKKIARLHPSLQEILSVKTHYEQIFSAQGKPITYLKFNFSAQGG